MSEMNHPQALGSTRLGFADEGELDRFVEKLEAFERGEVAPDAWRAFRLVHGVYGQRQDGPMMVRCKIPQGVLTPEQLVALAEVAEGWSTGRGHITTRQNVQFHFLKLEDVESVVRHLGAAGLTTREACGNSVRNITGCPYAGVSELEPFEVAEAVLRVLDRTGDRKNKAKARLKFVIERLGVEEFLAEYHKEREAIAAEGGRPVGELPAVAIPRLKRAFPQPATPGFDAFLDKNVRAQKPRGP